MTWRFPESYDTSFSETQQATAADGEVEYQLTVGAKPGVDRVSEGEALAQDADAATQLGVEDVDVEGATEEVSVGELSLTLATLDSAESSLRAFFLTPEDEDATYAVLFRAGTSLADTPDERLAEVYQMVASLELEPEQGFDG